MTVDDTLSVLQTNEKTGLSSSEVRERLKAYGPNELTETPPRSLWSMFIGQLKETLVLMLIAAAIISGILGEWTDAAVILLIVFFNAALGVLHERRAENAMRALKELSQPLAKVIQDGTVSEIPGVSWSPGT